MGAGALCPLARADTPAADAVDEQVADVVAVRAQGQLQLDLVGNDIVLRPSVDRADGQDRRMHGIDLAAHDRLEVHDGQGRQHDRIDGGVRARAVAAASLDDHVNRR